MRKVLILVFILPLALISSNAFGTVRCFPEYLSDGSIAATLAGDLEALKEALKKYPGSASEQDGCNRYTIQIAAEQPLVRYMIENGAVINNTPLFAAIKVDDLEMCRLLLEKGADPNAGQSIPTPLLYAIGLPQNKNMKQMVKLLLENGADVNSTDKYGRTPLHKAAYRGHEEIVRVLLSFGAKKKKEDSEGHTALHLATQKRRTSVIELLK